jgi:hypothetical protein
MAIRGFLCSITPMTPTARIRNESIRIIRLAHAKFFQKKFVEFQKTRPFLSPPRSKYRGACFFCSTFHLSTFSRRAPQKTRTPKMGPFGTLWDIYQPLNRRAVTPKPSPAKDGDRRASRDAPSKSWNDHKPLSSPG